MLLTKEHRNKLQNLGGDGILHLKLFNGVWEAQRNIILGSNVENYPAVK